MVVYTFDYATGVYTGDLQLTIVNVDPRSNAWLIPGNATTEQPPRCDVNTMVIWHNGRWEVIECVAEIPDALLAKCRAGMEVLRESYAHLKTEKVP